MSWIVANVAEKQIDRKNQKQKFNKIYDCVAKVKWDNAYKEKYVNCPYHPSLFATFIFRVGRFSNTFQFFINFLRSDKWIGPSRMAIPKQETYIHQQQRATLSVVWPKWWWWSMCRWWDFGYRHAACLWHHLLRGCWCLATAVKSDRLCLCQTWKHLHGLKFLLIITFKTNNWTKFSAVAVATAAAAPALGHCEGSTRCYDVSVVAWMDGGPYFEFNRWIIIKSDEFFILFSLCSSQKNRFTASSPCWPLTATVAVAVASTAFDDFHFHLPAKGKNGVKAQPSICAQLKRNSWHRFGIVTWGVGNERDGCCHQQWTEQ